VDDPVVEVVKDKQTEMNQPLTRGSNSRSRAGTLLSLTIHPWPAPSETTLLLEESRARELYAAALEERQAFEGERFADLGISGERFASLRLVALDDSQQLVLELTTILLADRSLQRRRIVVRAETTAHG
jgi:hypothetical protein